MWEAGKPGKLTEPQSPASPHHHSSHSNLSVRTELTFKDVYEPVKRSNKSHNSTYVLHINKLLRNRMKRIDFHGWIINSLTADWKGHLTKIYVFRL